MIFEYKNLNINYVDNKLSLQPIVLLHGWGQNIEMMEPIGKCLSETNRVIIIDFPSFGASDELLEVWNVDTYTDMLHELLAHINVENPIIIGHSFGCRVAIKYSIKFPVLKMIFTGGAGIRPKRGIVYHTKVRFYKMSKVLFKLPFLKNHLSNVSSKFGSADYRQTSDAMRGTFVNIVNEDLTNCLPSIKCPVLLIWGKNDEATPLSDAKLMEQLITDCALIELNGTHYAYLENITYFNTIVKEFVK